MRNVLNLLYRMVGPLIFVVGIAVFYLLTDSLGVTLSFVKSKYSNTDTYSFGQVSNPRDTESTMTGIEVKSILVNGAAVGGSYRVRSPKSPGSSETSDTIVTYTSTGYTMECDERVAVYSTLQDLLTSINDNYLYTVRYDYSESNGLTSATFMYSGVKQE